MITMKVTLNSVFEIAREISGVRGEQCPSIMIRSRGAMLLLANLSVYFRRSKEGCSESLALQLRTESL